MEGRAFEKAISHETARIVTNDFYLRLRIILPRVFHEAGM